jgi:tetratricopeptide (TPR) repeat protein
MILVFALTMALASAPPAAGSKTVTTAAQLERLIQDGKAGDAVKQGRPDVAARPDDVDLRLALARALAAQARKANRQVNVTLSKEDAERGELKVDDADVRSATLHVDYDNALLDEALAQLDAGIKRAPQRADLRVFQCFLLTDSGRIVAAKAAIVGALSALPKTPATAKTMTSYGAERAKRGDPGGGAELLAPVVSAFPDDAAIEVDYANVLTRLGRKNESYDAFDRATQLAPHDVRYVRTKAIGAMLLRDFRRARSTFDTAFRMGHDVSDQFASYVASYGLDPKVAAGFMGELGSPAAGADPEVVKLAHEFERAGTAGASSDAALALARSLLAAQQYVFAIPVLDRALKAAPGNAEATTMLKTTYRALGCESLGK